MKYALDHNNNQEKYGENLYHRNCSVTSRRMSAQVIHFVENDLCLIPDDGTWRIKVHLGPFQRVGSLVMPNILRFVRLFDGFATFLWDALDRHLVSKNLLNGSGRLPVSFEHCLLFEQTLVLYLNLWRSKFYSSRSISQEWRLRDFFTRVRSVSNITCQGG